MTILWIVLAFVAGSVFGAVTMSLLAAGGKADAPDKLRKNDWLHDSVHIRSCFEIFLKIWINPHLRLRFGIVKANFPSALSLRVNSFMNLSGINFPYFFSQIVLLSFSKTRKNLEINPHLWLRFGIVKVDFPSALTLHGSLWQQNSKQFLKIR